MAVIIQTELSEGQCATCAITQVTLQSFAQTIKKLATDAVNLATLPENVPSQTFEIVMDHREIREILSATTVKSMAIWLVIARMHVWNVNDQAEETVSIVEGMDILPGIARTQEMNVEGPEEQGE